MLKFEVALSPKENKIATSTEVVGELHTIIIEAAYAVGKIAAMTVDELESIEQGHEAARQMINSIIALATTMTDAGEFDALLKEEQSVDTNEQEEENNA